MKKEGNINFYNVFIEFYKFSVTVCFMNINFKQIKYNITPISNRVIKQIVIHDTGNVNKGANAEMHFKYFDGDNRNASADFFVDDNKILQVTDYNKYYTWHCGDGNGKYGITNKNFIGI